MASMSKPSRPPNSGSSIPECSKASRSMSSCESCWRSICGSRTSRTCRPVRRYPSYLEVMLSYDMGARDMSRDQLKDRLDTMIAILEDIVNDRGLLAALSAEDRTRLMRAAGQIYNPDTAARRHLVKAIEKRRKAERANRDERVLHATGIRVLRRQPVFTTPNVFAPADFDAADVAPETAHKDGEDAKTSGRGGGSTVDEKHCYVCKRTYSELHHFYDQLCPDCAVLNFTK